MGFRGMDGKVELEVQIRGGNMWFVDLMRRVVLGDVWMWR
jgi:hypothetical protein